MSNEHIPFGGGIGVSVPALAGLLAAEHEVTLVTRARAGATLPDPAPGVRRVFAEPDDHARGGFACPQHAYSAAVLGAIEAAYGDGHGPDLLEAPDYEAEGFVALQAARTGHALLARTRFVVRLRGTAEIAYLHDDEWPGEEDRLAVYAMEREVLARADRIVYAGGDTHAACARYYGDAALAPATRVRLPLPPLPVPADFVPRRPGEPLRLLYAGRLERRKGVIELVEAVLRLAAADLRLTLVGADTPSGPLERSMRATLEAMAAGDERIEILGERPRAELQALFGASDVAVLPSRFEWWSNVALEAMHAGLAVLATPVGGFTEQVVPGETGWLADGTDARSLASALERLVADPAAVDAVRASGAPQRHLARLTDRRDVLAGYRALLEAPMRRRPATVPVELPRITAVIPAHDAGELTAEAVASFLDQAGDGGDVIVVDDGSGPASAGTFDELRRDPRVRALHRRQGGVAAARNTGIEHAESDYVLVLDADDVLEPGHLARSVAALQADPGLGYAVTWFRVEYADGVVDPARPTGWCPLGAGPDLMLDRNVVGGSCVLFPRRVFSELGYRYTEIAAIIDDRELLQQLWRDQRPGAVVPAALLRRRHHESGISGTYAARHRPAALREMRARLRARDTQWTAPAA